MTKKYDHTLKVGNLVQRALFCGEIKGQLSDGMWENTRPFDHWKVWCDADVVVAKGAKNVGRDFYAEKDDYNLVALLQYVGDRMLAIARFAMVWPELITELLDEGLQIPDSEYDLDYYFNMNYFKQAGRTPSEYAQKVHDLFERHGVSDVMWLAVLRGEYLDAKNFTEKDLRDNLRGLKVAMKTWQPHFERSIFS